MRLSNKVKIALLLSLSLLAGCSFSAGISRGQDVDLMPSVLVDNDDFRSVHNATVRVRAYNGGKLEWMGSGLAYKVEDNRVFILSNEHVCGGADRITAEFFRNGRSLGEFNMRVDMCKQNNDGIDIGVISCNIGKTLKGIEPIGFASSNVAKGDEVFFVGAARGEWPKGKIGRVLRVTDKHFYSSPTSIGGDSGSSMVRFREDGEAEIVGLVAWYAIENGERVCMSMHASVVLEVLAGGEIPDLGDAPPIAEGTERLIQGLLERLRELREENRRERKGLIDRISQLQMENAMAQEESRRLFDLFRKKQDEQIEKQDNIADKVIGQFDTLKAMIKLLKWSFYAMIAAVVASVIFGQGWLLKIVITILKIKIRVFKSIYSVIKDAVTTPIREIDNASDAIDELRSEVQEEIGRGDDSAS